MLGGLQGVGDHPLGLNMGESRQLVHQILGVIGGLELGRHPEPADGGGSVM
jgi:hypothetical protein